MSNKFEDLLTGAVAHQYNSKRFSLGWLHTEVRANASGLSSQLDADMVHLETLRKAIGDALAKAPEEQPTTAAKWATFLKPRIETLDYWASLIAAIGALLVGGCALLAVLDNYDKGHSQVFLVMGATLGLLAGIARFEIDRRKLWYKYLVTHLDAIASRSWRRS